MTKDEQRLVDRVVSRLSIHKGQVLYGDDLGFDYQKYLQLRHGEQLFIEEMNLYLEEETGASCYIKNIELGKKNEVIITIAAGTIDIKKTIGGFLDA